MKVFGKYLVFGITNGKKWQVCSGFKTRKEAIENLTLAGFERMSDNIWIDSKKQVFFIEKNTVEY